MIHMSTNKSNKPELRFKGFSDDWEQRKLGEVFNFHYGDGNNNPSNGGQYPVFGAGGIQGRYTKYNAENSIIIGHMGDAGCVSWGEGKHFVTYNGTITTPKDNVFTAKFGYYLLLNMNLRKYRGGSGLPFLTYDMLTEMETKCPNSKIETQEIADYFTQLDHLIALHQRKCDNLKIIKKSMLDNLFPKIGEKVPKWRFKGFNNDWEQRKFVSVFEGLQNNTLSRADLNYENGTVKNVHYGDVLIKFGDYIDASRTDLPYISDDAKTDKFKNSFLQDGDIIIADTAEDDTVGKCTEIQGSEGLKLLSGLHTVACRPKEKYGPMFLGYYINSPAYHNQLKPLMQGIKVTSISKPALQDTDMIMPKSIEEQTMIGGCFANLDSLITLHQREVEQLKKAKQFFLEKMFI